MDIQEAQRIKAEIHRRFPHDGSTVRVKVVTPAQDGRRWFYSDTIAEYDCPQWVDVFDAGDGSETDHTGQPHPWALAKIYRSHPGMDIVYLGDLPSGVLRQCLTAQDVLAE